jgi:hypothetical protein
VVSTEINRYQYGYCLARFLVSPRVQIYQLDARLFLERVLNETPVSNKVVFFYLDAHWQEDLPLLDEIEIVFKSPCLPLVVIDDFRVPNDSGYQFDNFGPGKSLELETLQHSRERFSLTALFPNCASELETGRKRGMVMLARDSQLIDQVVKTGSFAVHE